MCSKFDIYLCTTSFTSRDKYNVFLLLEINRIYNLMSISEETNTNFKAYWQCGHSDNDPNGDKHMRTVYDIIPDGNFRSALVDDWFLEPPHEVRLCHGVVTKLKQGRYKRQSSII